MLDIGDASRKQEIWNYERGYRNNLMSVKFPFKQCPNAIPPVFS